MPTHPLAGVYAAALTPLKPDYSIDTESIIPLLNFLAERGCHGALLFGTTGEGPAFAYDERVALMRAATEIRSTHPQFRLLAGTGTPSLQETIALTRAAFELGYEGAVVLPPYYFRKVSDEGLFVWFSEVLTRAVPNGGALFAYHIPLVSGVPISTDLLTRLRDAFPGRFAGLKDSSADAEHAKLLGKQFGHSLLNLNGTDSLLTLALEAGAQGCITAMGNLFSPELRAVWDAFNSGGDGSAAQARLEKARAIMDRYPPAASTQKALIARHFNFARWAVRPPLLPVSKETADEVSAELEAAGVLGAN